MRVYVEEKDPDTCNMWELNGFEITNDWNEADVICYVGGADVSPELYNQENSFSSSSVNRDFKSLAIFSRTFWDPDKIHVGICRGGQFLNVMMGGWMVQDKPYHTDEFHQVKGPMGSVLLNSYHHQGMIPNMAAGALTYSTEDDDNVEVIVYKNYNVLCFQPHPEWSRTEDETEEFFFSIFRRFFK